MEALEGVSFELHLQCASVTLCLLNPILWGRCFSSVEASGHQPLQPPASLTQWVPSRAQDRVLLASTLNGLG
jgi:hypothetical protein